MSTMGVLAISRGNSPYRRGRSFPGGYAIVSMLEGHCFHLVPTWHLAQVCHPLHRLNQHPRAPAPFLSHHTPVELLVICVPAVLAATALQSGIKAQFRRQPTAMFLASRSARLLDAISFSNILFSMSASSSLEEKDQVVRMLRWSHLVKGRNVGRPASLSESDWLSTDWLSPDILLSTHY